MCPKLFEKIISRSDFSGAVVISSGPSGTIRAGKNKTTQENVIIKEFSESFEGEFQKLFMNHVESLSLLEHPKILKFHGFALPSPTEIGCPITISEYPRNGSLEWLLRNKYNLFNDYQKMRIIFDIALGMQYIHHCGVVHGNLKPENIFFKENHEVVIGGIANFDYGKTLTVDLSSAPETISGGIKSMHSDVYSFGMIVFQILTGKVPFEGQNGILPKICQGQRPDIPPLAPANYRALMNRCWSFHEPDRPSFRNIVESFANGKLDLDAGASSAIHKYINASLANDSVYLNMKQAEGLVSRGESLMKTDVAGAVNLFKQASDMNYYKALFRYGYCLLTATSIAKDEVKGAEYIKRSAEQGYSYGLLYYGHCLKRGLGVEKDERRAFKYYLGAANHGITEAQLAVSKCYAKGVIDTPNKDDLAVQWAREAAKNGDPKGCRVYAGYLLTGRKRDPAGAEAMLWKAVEGGDVKALEQYICLENGQTGRLAACAKRLADCGVPEYQFQHAMSLRGTDLGEMTKYLTKAAEQSHYQAAVELAKLPDGQGRTLKFLQQQARTGDSAKQAMYAAALHDYGQYEEAYVYWEKSAAQGNADGELGLALALRNGYGCSKNPVLYEQYIKKAANNGSVMAMNSYGCALVKDEGWKSAMSYFKKAAQGGNTTAMYNYALCVLKDSHTKAELAEAIQLLRRGAEMRDPSCCVMLGMHIYKTDKSRRMEAMQLFGVAADQNHPDGEFWLGKCLLKGVDGAKQYEKALAMFKRAAKHDCKLAELGSCYALAKARSSRVGAA